MEQIWVSSFLGFQWYFSGLLILSLPLPGPAGHAGAGLDLVQHMHGWPCSAPCKVV